MAGLVKSAALSGAVYRTTGRSDSRVVYLGLRYADRNFQDLFTPSLPSDIVLLPKRRLILSRASIAGFGFLSLRSNKVRGRCSSGNKSSSITPALINPYCPMLRFGHAPVAHNLAALTNSNVSEDMGVICMERELAYWGLSGRCLLVW